MITVKVTQDHINEGIRNACSECPVALSVTEVLKGGLLAYVTNCVIIRGQCDDKLVSKFYKFDDNTQRFIKDFDRGKPVKPMEFECNIPEEYLR